MILKDESILTVGLLFPLLTVLGFAAAYYYELGFFTSYNMPIEFIRIELGKSGFLIFLFFPTFFFLYLSMEPFVANILIIKNSKSWIKKTVFLLFLVYFCFLTLPLILQILKQKRLILVYVTLAFGILLTVIKFKKKEVNKPALSDVFPILANISLSFGKIVGPIVISASLICIIMFIAGRESGGFQNRYYSKKSNNTILLRSYSSYNIYGIEDSPKHGFSKFIISRSMLDNDTLYLETK